MIIMVMTCVCHITRNIVYAHCAASRELWCFDLLGVGCTCPDDLASCVLCLVSECVKCTQ